MKMKINFPIMRRTYLTNVVVAFALATSLLLVAPSATRAVTPTCNLITVTTTGPSGSTAAIPYTFPSCNFDGACVWNLNANPTSTAFSTIQFSTGNYNEPVFSGQSVTINIYATAGPSGASNTY